MTFTDIILARQAGLAALLAKPVADRIADLVGMDILIAKPRYGHDANVDAFLGVNHRSYELRVGTACLRSDANVWREQVAWKLLQSLAGHLDALDAAWAGRCDRMAA